MRRVLPLSPLRTQRLIAGFSLEELAAELGVSAVTVRRREALVEPESCYHEAWRTALRRLKARRSKVHQ